MRFEISFLGLPQDEESVGGQISAHNKVMEWDFTTWMLAGSCAPNSKGTAWLLYTVAWDKGGHINTTPFPIKFRNYQLEQQLTTNQEENCRLALWNDERFSPLPLPQPIPGKWESWRGRHRCHNRNDLASTVHCWNPISSLHCGTGKKRALIQIVGDYPKMNRAEY